MELFPLDHPQPNRIQYYTRKLYASQSEFSTVNTKTIRENQCEKLVFLAFGWGSFSSKPFHTISRQKKHPLWHPSNKPSAGRFTLKSPQNMPHSAGNVVAVPKNTEKTSKWHISMPRQTNVLDHLPPCRLKSHDLQVKLHVLQNTVVFLKFSFKLSCN